jgi:hypothetical protein
MNTRFIEYEFFKNKIIIRKQKLVYVYLSQALKTIFYGGLGYSREIELTGIGPENVNFNITGQGIGIGSATMKIEVNSPTVTGKNKKINASAQSVFSGQ